MKISIEIMYNTLYNCPEDIFLCVKDIKPQSVIGYVVFFREKGIDEKHPGKKEEEKTPFFILMLFMHFSFSFSSTSIVGFR